MTITFSLILNYPKNIASDCTSLNNANEGVLLIANVLNYPYYLHFYYSKNKTATDKKPRIAVEHLNRTNLRLNNTIDVPGTLDKAKGLLNFSVNTTQLFETTARLKWEQNTQPARQDCDVWSMDNVAVTLHYKYCTRNVFSDDFEKHQ